jgi:predicted alpha/beta hydrolase
MEDVYIAARDGYSLAATLFDGGGEQPATVVLISSATAVPRRFYQPLAEFFCEQGYIAITYDYRGIGGSCPQTLRGFQARARDWALQDMAGVIDWLQERFAPRRLFMIGHSYGGQTAGLLPNGEQVDAMVTLSAQSGYWKLQGGSQKWTVAFHVYLTLPLLAHLIGYVPWSKFSKAEDLPKGVALEWSSWCRQPGYLLDDDSLPLERFQDFTAPVLAYSFGDDDWGTARSVEAMMSAYPNLVRRHVVPADIALESIGHFGFFRPKAKKLWREAIVWLEQAAPLQV